MTHRNQPAGFTAIDLNTGNPSDPDTGLVFARDTGLLSSPDGCDLGVSPADNHAHRAKLLAMTPDERTQYYACAASYRDMFPRPEPYSDHSSSMAMFFDFAEEQ